MPGIHKVGRGLSRCVFHTPFMPALPYASADGTSSSACDGGSGGTCGSND